MTSNQQQPSKPDPAAVLSTSGFAFQIAVEAKLKALSSTLNWSRLSAEHRWQHPTGEHGFADIIAESDTWRLIVECKRQTNPWYFIRNADKTLKETRLSSLVGVNNSASGKSCRCWSEWPFNPESAEAEYCTVPGWNTEQRPLLERTCTDLVRACEAIALDESGIWNARRTDLMLSYFPAIVTNADLVLCELDAGPVSLQTGKVDSLRSSVVPWLRFRKTLPIASDISPPSPADLGALNLASSVSMFVVSASALEEFLRAFDARAWLSFGAKVHGELLKKMRAHCGLAPQ